MAILRIRDENGVVHGVRALKGEAGAGVHFGRYVGNAENGDGSQQISLESPHVRAVLLCDIDESMYLSAVLVTADGAGYGGETVARLVADEKGTIQLEVQGAANYMGDKYTYIAFIEEAAE